MSMLAKWMPVEESEGIDVVEEEAVESEIQAKDKVSSGGSTIALGGAAAPPPLPPPDVIHSQLSGIVATESRYGTTVKIVIVIC